MPAPKIDLTANQKNKKIVFDDDGDIVAEVVKKVKKPKKKKFDDIGEELKLDDENETNNALNADEADEEDYFGKRDRLKHRKEEGVDDDAQKKWFQVYPQFPTSNEFEDMKDSEQMELFNLCKVAFEAQNSAFLKRNPSDSRWLQTALHKGTGKDRANAGALLVTSNPLGNLEALSTLITFTKISNKSSPEVIAILTDLWKEVLLPSYRKLISIPMRATDWKIARKDTTLSKEKLRKIYAYWYFENELKEHYFEFLKNLQQGIQSGQENNKNASIIAASQLLAYAPEKEQMLLTMLINKLGDPSSKIASKALHHLSEVAHKHPNMCGVIVAESEKLLFRNNISDRAQHFALCFLSCIAPSGRPEVCTKLVHICFSLFKVLVQKGAVNNRTMQAILRCLQKAILEAKPAEGSTEIMSKEMQDTVYRLVHLADIRVSVQTLSLLLQLMTVSTGKSDRFYNALYRKMLDLELTAIGTKTAAQLLHIIHRAIHIDTNVPRAQAFIKRLLQIALHMPAPISAGCLIVIHKLQRSRKELPGGDGRQDVGNADNDSNEAAVALPKVSVDDEELAKFDSDGEEKYEDIKDEDDLDKEISKADISGKKEEEEGKKPASASSWYHAKLTSVDTKISQISASNYDAYHRVPAYAGAEYALRSELLLLREHFHPTVQVFADNIINQKRINYYGDPLRDFGLPHFLERFAFKNPKKLDNSKAEMPTMSHKRYVSFGTRGKPVKSLTKVNCTEDEMFIFNYLEQKRQKAVLPTKKNHDDGDADDLKVGEVDDDEFEEYLDGYFGKKAKVAADDDADEEELDFLKELCGELKDDENKKQKKKKKTAADEDGVEDSNMEEVDADWGDDEVNSDLEFAGSDASDDEAGSVELEDDEDDDDDGGSISLDEATLEDDDLSEPESEGGMSDDDDEELSPPKSKSRRHDAALDSRSFTKKLKHSDDMRSLFAAADDFAELLEETGKTKGQGTANAIFNKDKSSAKQLKWEEKRRSNSKNYTKKAGGGKKFSRKSDGKSFRRK